MSTSWDPSSASKRFPYYIHAAAWSPCNRFIAVTWDESSKIVILDAMTLEQLYTLYFPIERVTLKCLAFSPDSCLLTSCSRWGQIITWDLQIGGIITSINPPETTLCISISYSRCGTMVGCLFYGDTIMIYNILSGTCISSHSVQQSAVKAIWTHGEYLQFATVKPESIIIWELGFTSAHTPTKVSSLATPDGFSTDRLVPSSTFSHFAYVYQGRVIVWATQHNRLLLDSRDIDVPLNLSFSSDSCFFLCGSQSSEFHVWKRTSEGYLPYQRLLAGARVVKPIISPNGQSIISFGSLMLQLWHTTNSTTSLPRVSAQHGQWDPDDFFFELSPDGSLAAAAQRLSYTVNILDIKSGSPWLVIEMDTMVCGMRITENKVHIVGSGKVVIWDLPVGDHLLHAKRDVSHSVQTIAIKHSEPIECLYASISPNLDYIGFGYVQGIERCLSIYSMHTGEKLAVANPGGWLPGFTSVGDKIWCATSSGLVEWWEIIKDIESNDINLELLDKKEKLPGLPFISSCGYQVTSDGWTCSSSGRRLLWLPKHWLPSGDYMLWHEKFLAMWNSGLLEPIILELEI